MFIDPLKEKTVLKFMLGKQQRPNGVIRGAYTFLMPADLSEDEAVARMPRNIAAERNAYDRQRMEALFAAGDFAIVRLLA